MKIILGVILRVPTFLAQCAFIHQAVSDRLRFNGTLLACGTSEHVESFHVMLKLEDPFPCNDFSESWQMLPSLATVVVWMGIKGHIVIDLGKRGFGCPSVLPVLFTEALMCFLELIMHLGRYHRAYIVMKDLL